MGNIVKLVFQAVTQGSGFGKLLGEVKGLQSALPGVSQGAAILGQAFGTAGAALGRMAAMLLQGGVWSAAAEGVRLVIDRMGLLRDRSAEVRQSLEEQKRAHAALLAAAAGGYDAALAKLDREASRRKELVALTQRQAKALLEIRRAQAVMSGDTSTAAALDDEISKRDGRAAVERADADVSGAEARVRAAQDALAAAQRVARRFDRRLADAEAALEEKAKPVQTLMQSSAGAYWQTTVRDTTAEEAAVRAAQAEADAAEEKVEAARLAVETEMRGLSDARRARETAALEQEAAERRAAADRQKAEADASAARARAEADARAAADREHKANLLAAEDERRRKAEEDERERARNAAALARRDEAEQHRRRLGALAQEADHYRQMLAAAHGDVADAWDNYRDPGRLDQAGERRAKRQEAIDAARFEKDAERLQRRKDWRTSDRLSNRDRATRDLIFAKEREKEAGDHLANLDRTVKGLVDKIEGLTAL